MSDGTVTIKIQANDKKLTDLVKHVQDLRTQLNSLSNINPFEVITTGAERARNALLGVSDTSTDVSRSLDGIDGQGVESVGDSANRADAELGELTYTANDVDSSIDNIDSVSLDVLGSSADKADAELDGLTYTAMDVDSAVSGIDPDSVMDLGTSADRSESEMADLGSTAKKTAGEVDSVDGSSVSDVGDSANKAQVELDEAGRSAKKVKDEVDKIDPKPVQDTEESSNRLNISFLGLAQAVGVVKLVSFGFDMLRNSIDGAIDRFDTFNTFPRTMEGLGHSTEQADRAIRRLDQGTRGLPTTMDGIVKSVQRIVSVTGDLNLATDTALALNNAFLASGSSAADAARGTEQYVQMLSKGEADLQSYRTLQETMTLALNKTAESFGFAGEAAQTDLYAALKGGSITFREFNAQLIELSNEVGGFADLAQTNSESLRTSWTNLGTAFVRNTANILTKFDELSKALTGNSIAQNIDSMQQVINKAFSAIGTSIDLVTPIIVATVDGFRLLHDATEPLHPVFMAAAAGIGTMMILNKVNTLIKSSTAYTGAYVLVTDLLAGASARAAAAKATLSGAVGIWSKAAVIATGTTTALGTAINFMLGPIGWITIGIGALVGGFTLLRNMAAKTHPELDRMAIELEGATDATESLNDSVKASAESYESTQARLEGQTNSIRTLMEDTKALSEQEVLSAGEKKILKDNIDELNTSVEGLSLSYDEERGMLTSSNEAMDLRLSMMDEENNMAAQRERLNEIEQQRTEIQQQMTENTQMTHEAEQALADSRESWWGRVKDNLNVGEDLRGQAEANSKANAELKETYTSLEEEQAQVMQSMTESSDRYAESSEAANSQVITSIGQLQEKQREVAETIQSTAQSMTERLMDWGGEVERAYTKAGEDGEEYAVSANETFNDVKKGMLDNQEAASEWAEGLNDMAKRGVDEGMIHWLREMGLEGLPLVNSFVEQTDEELAELAEIMNENGELGKEGALAGLDFSEEEIRGLDNLISGFSTTLQDEIRDAGLDEIMKKSGENMAKGAAEGVKSGTPEAVRATEDMANDLDSSFKKHLGIHSPSTVFAQHGSDLIAGLLQGIERAKPQVLQLFAQLGLEMNRTMQQSLQSMNQGSTSAFDGFVKNVQQTFGQSRMIMANETNDMNRTFQQGMTMLSRTSLQGTTELQRTFQTSFKSINQNARTETSQMNNTWQSSMTQQQRVARNGYNGMVTTARSSMNNVLTVTRSTMNQAVTVMQNTASQARNAGYNMGLGFRNGLASTQGSVISTARNIANAASNTIKSALRIQSPSKVTEALGEFTGEGLVQGMRSKVTDVEQIAKEMAQKALPQIDVGRSLGSVGGMAASSAVYNNQQYVLNANSSAGASGMSREEIQRLFREFAWYIKQEGGALDG